MASKHILLHNTNDPEAIRAYLAAIVESSRDAIISKNLDGIITSWNAAAETILGYTADEAIGQHITLIIPPQHLDEELRIIGDLKAGQRIDHFETMRRAKDGTLIDVSITISPIRDKNGQIIGASKVLRDISERRHADLLLQKTKEELEQHVSERTEELKHQQIFLQTIIDAVADPIFVKDSQHRWIEGNDAFWRLLGSEETIRGKSDYDIFPKEQADQFWENDNRVFKSNQPYDAEEKLRAQDGTDLIIATRKMPFRLASGEQALVGVIRDITAQRATEEELRLHRDNLQQLVLMQTQDLTEAKDRAEAANQAKSEFLANMSHEIRTPMNAVVGLSTILAESSPLTDKQRNFINTLKISADALLTLINDLLDISKIEARTIDLEHVPFQLDTLIQDVASMLEVRIREKQLTFINDSAAVAGHTFMGDPARLRQVILNICSNAVKFTEQGTIAVSVIYPAPDSVRRNLVSIIIKDTGIGIAADKIDTIFDKFIQADSSINRKYGGTGLGLAITKALVGIMDGSLTVESTPGHGSSFTITVPLARAASAAVTRQAGQNPGDSVKQRILLVEDNPANVMVAASYLERFGYACDIAIHGREAIDKIQSQTYVLAIMDVQMPGLNGLDTTIAIRAWETENGHARLPIIGMTAHAQIFDRERCLAAGMDDYMPKPFNPEELRAKLEHFTSQIK